LIDRMEREVAAATRAAEEARRAAETQAGDQERFAAAFRDRPGSPKKSPSRRRAACCRARGGEMVRDLARPTG
jgi:hypothetical protein